MPNKAENEENMSSVSADLKNISHTYSCVRLISKVTNTRLFLILGLHNNSQSIFEILCSGSRGSSPSRYGNFLREFLLLCYHIRTCQSCWDFSIHIPIRSSIFSLLMHVHVSTRSVDTFEILYPFTAHFPDRTVDNLIMIWLHYYFPTKSW